MHPGVENKPDVVVCFSFRLVNWYSNTGFFTAYIWIIQSYHPYNIHGLIAFDYAWWFWAVFFQWFCPFCSFDQLFFHWCSCWMQILWASPAYQNISELHWGLCIVVYFQNGLRVMVYYLPPGQTRYKSHPGKLKHNKQALYNKHIKVDTSHIDCQFAVIAKSPTKHHLFLAALLLNHSDSVSVQSKQWNCSAFGPPAGPARCFHTYGMGPQRFGLLFIIHVW